MKWVTHVPALTSDFTQPERSQKALQFHLKLIQLAHEIFTSLPESHPSYLKLLCFVAEINLVFLLVQIDEAL